MYLNSLNTKKNIIYFFDFSKRVKKIGFCIKILLAKVLSLNKDISDIFDFHKFDIS